MLCLKKINWYVDLQIQVSVMLGFCTAINFHLFTMLFLRICNGSSLYSYSCMIYRHLQTFLHLVCKSKPLLIRVEPCQELLEFLFSSKSCCSLPNDPVMEEGLRKFNFQQCWEKMGEIIVFLTDWERLLSFMGNKIKECMKFIVMLGTIAHTSLSPWVINYICTFHLEDDLQ